MIPHITDEIKSNFYKLGETGLYDFIITEIGGCVGDIESLPFIEAVRQTRFELGSDHVVAIHLTLIPYLKAAGELKTKPTQHSVKELLEAGIQPDILVCRSEYELNDEIRRKLALFCNVQIDHVIESLDAETIYDVPILMLKEKLDLRVLDKFKIKSKEEPNIAAWKEYLVKLKNPTSKIRVGLVGKYIELKDAYKSIIESFIHAGTVNECKVEIVWIQSEDIKEDNCLELLGKLNGILVAPGFGKRGVEGKISAIKIAREHQIPFFGICLGMQCAVVEFARNVLKLEGASSTELNNGTQHPVIDIMENQKNIKEMGGTMRLGAFKCSLEQDSLVGQVYGQHEISERHRHRYEFNNDYLSQFKAAGMMASGVNQENHLVEIMELNNHPWFIATQFHPELKSTVVNPHPLFVGFVQAALKYKKNQ